MVKWVREEVLQRYFVERCSRYTYKGHKLISARFNQPISAYPDLYCRLDNNKEVPAEVEWKTSDFNHETEVLKQNDGFLVVYKKDQNFEFDQVEIDAEDFSRWFADKAPQLLNESVKELEETERREFPELWFYYLDKSSFRHFTMFSMGYSDNEGIWGVPGIVKKFRQLNRFRQIQKGDLILFISGWKAKGKGGRVPLNKFKGEITLAELHRITTDYFYDETKIWDEPKGWAGELYPHRFKFDKHPIVALKNISIKPLSFSTKSNLHKLLSATLFWNGDSPALLDMISHGKQ